MTLNKSICKMPWNSLIVNYDGKCYNCCYQSKPFGNLSDQSFNEIWNGKEIKEMREILSLGGFPENCINNSALCPYQGKL